MVYQALLAEPSFGIADTIVCNIVYKPLMLE